MHDVRPVLLDVTRLIFRLLKGKRPTGVDRVGLAYVAHFANIQIIKDVEHVPHVEHVEHMKQVANAVDRDAVATDAVATDAVNVDAARAVLAWQGRVRVLSRADSTRLFTALLDEQPLRFGRVFWLRFLARLVLPSRGGVGGLVNAAWNAVGRVFDRSASIRPYAGCFVFNTGHKGLELRTYSDAVLGMGLRPIYFVHDLIPLTHAEYCRAGEEALHFARMDRVLRDAAGVVVNSDFTRAALVDFAGLLHLPVPPICTAWLASALAPNTMFIEAEEVEAGDDFDRIIAGGWVDEDQRLGVSEQGAKELYGALASADEVDLESARGANEGINDGVKDGKLDGADLFGSILPFEPRPYFVMLSTIEGRKNHLLVLHVWREWAQQCARVGTQPPMLVLIGQRGWECEQVLDLLERSQGVRSCVVELNHCSDFELAQILGQAQALLFPSFVEGFGMPLVEALGAGVPVIASDIPVFVEIAQGIPELLNPLDGPAWLRCVQAYALPNSPERSAQLARLKGYQPWTWPQHFAKVTAFMRDELGAG